MSKAKLIKIAVCGSSNENLPTRILKKAEEMGKVLARKEIASFYGATTGYSYQVAKEAIKHGGLTIGISPAESRQEHISLYKLPVDAYKLMLFTGLGYKARDVVLIRSVDAAIFIGGGTGTICELCIAIDYKKVIGVLAGSQGATNLFKKIAAISHRAKPQYIYEKRVDLLVKRVVEAAGKEK